MKIPIIYYVLGAAGWFLWLRGLFIGGWRLVRLRQGRTLRRQTKYARISLHEIRRGMED